MMQRGQKRRQVAVYVHKPKRLFGAPSSSYVKRKSSWKNYRRFGRYPVRTPAHICVNRAPGPFPMVYRTTQHYATEFKHTNAGGFYDWVFRGNSVYDPDFAIGGETANGYTKLATLYGYYKVTASRIEVSVINLDEDDPVTCAIIPNRFSTSYAVGNKYATGTQPYATSIIVTPEAGVGHVMNSCSTRKIMNVRNLDDEGHKSATGTNPAHGWYWHVVLYNQSANALSVTTKIRIFYTVEWNGLNATEQ